MLQILLGVIKDITQNSDLSKQLVFRLFNFTLPASLHHILYQPCLVCFHLVSQLRQVLSEEIVESRRHLVSHHDAVKFFVLRTRVVHLALPNEFWDLEVVVD
jgi:hypothetical protein